VSAQSWEGLAGTQDERNRVAATAEGGIWLLRTPRPDPVVELAGTQPSVDTTRRFDGAGPWSDDGLSRARPAPVLDGDLVRRLEVGQVAYVYRGGVTFLQIKRLTGKQAALGPGLASVMAAGLAGGARRGAGPTGGSGQADGDARWLAGVGASTADPAAGADADAGWLAGVGASGEPPTIPLPPIRSEASALPDVSEVLDDAFGVRRD
jgi:hypothetical protein